MFAIWMLFIRMDRRTANHFRFSRLEDGYKSKPESIELLEIKSQFMTDVQINFKSRVIDIVTQIRESTFKIPTQLSAGRIVEKNEEQTSFSVVFAKDQKQQQRKYC